MMDHGQGAEAVPADDLGELFDVAAAIVELGTGDDELLPFQELPVEAAQGESRAIGGDEKVGAPEIGRQGRDEVELDGPLAEAGFRRGVRPFRRALPRVRRDIAGGASRTSERGGGRSAVDPGSRVRAAAGEDVIEGGRRVIIVDVPLLDPEGARRTDVQAGPQAVAKELAGEHGLVLGVEDEGPFGAGRGAQAAAVAQGAVDGDDLPPRHLPNRGLTMLL